ncbi:MAG: hypothetical protein KGI54_07070 [Pseudomonadota bacterium]|nr:hypothetical protein [Pseudomonadota bacterium]
MAGVINTGTHPKLLWPGVHTVWGQMYAEHPVEYTDLFEVETSKKAYEEDVQVTGFGLAPVKGQGAPVEYDGEEQGYVTRYTHIAYGLGFIVTHEELMDNLYKEVATRRAKANAFSMNQTIENVAAFLYNNAFNSTYFTMADGQPLISNAHVQVSGGTFSNALTPGADLSEASLEDIGIQIMQMTSDKGLRVSAMGQSLHIAPQEHYNAERILKSVLQSDTANNNINVLKSTGAFPKGVKLNHYFTQPSAWFVRTNVPNGMRFFWRAKPEFAQDNDFNTKNALAASYMRFSLGATDPRGIYGSNGP